MSWPVYSERLLTAKGLRGMFYAMVPAGFRAVITDISIANPLIVLDQVQVLIEGQLLWMVTFQARDNAVRHELRVPVYQGEEIGVYNGDPTIQTVISGYLFSDATGRSGPLMEGAYDPTKPAPHALELGEG